MKSAVLLVVFRRPDTTRRVFDAVRRARPTRLYIAADGPRADRPDDNGPCAETRAIVDNVDWPCEVVRFYQDANVGLRHNLSSAVSTFLDREGEGIILEDDTVPSQTFFAYCDALLERHRDDERVGVISGYNPVLSRHFADDQYYFSETPMIWGWATWKRAWDGYDDTFARWDGTAKRFPASITSAQGAADQWVANFDSIASGRLGTVWSYQFIYHCWEKGLLSAIPGRTLVVNVGYGSTATHTTGTMPPKHIRKLTLAEIDPPLSGPREIAASRALDGRILADYWKLGRRADLRGRIAPIRNAVLSAVRPTS